MRAKSKLLSSLVAYAIIFSLALSLGNVVVAQTDPVVPADAFTIELEGGARTGAWVDEVIITEEPVAAAAITRLGLGELDIYAFSITDPDLFATVLANPNIDYVKNVGSHNEFTFNPVPFFNDGRLNPFGFPNVREAMNKLVDRNYIASEIQGGLAIPKYTALSAAFADAKDRYPDLVAGIVSKYAYNKAVAEAEISAEMEAQDAYIHPSKGTWHYDGQEIEILILARVEDERLVMGEYVAAQLEDIGFKCTVLPTTTAEASAIWLWTDPAVGDCHIYTGGWVTTVVSRDQGGNFAFFYTDMGYPVPLWLAYDTDPEFYEVCRKLNQNDFSTMEERRALFAKALPMSMEDSARIWLTDKEGFSAFRSNVCLAADTAGGIYGSWMWGHTVHFRGADGQPAMGGSMKIAMPSMLPLPPNPIAGSNWVYDMFWIRATGDGGWARDVRDGLMWPHKFEKAEVTVQTGLPVGVSTDLGHDWVTLSFAPSIQVPGDAWADWNAATQQFIPASTRFPGGTTAMRKSVVYYPKDIFEVPLHDGSILSMGDFIIGAILTFDRAKEASPIYDSSAVPSFNSFMSAFKGVRFIIDNPNYGLIVETYTDSWTLDAELMATHWWPVYAQGPAMWHTLAVAIRAEADKQLAFSSPKATELGVEWMSFIGGPSLTILRNQLTLAKAANYIPYAPTMGQYVTAEEAARRYNNLAAWSAISGKGHFWVANGPFYLEAAYQLTKVIQLARFEDYPGPADRWLFLAPCSSQPVEEYNLVISSTAGGTVTAPGEGTFLYDEGAVVNLLAEAVEGYRFVNWAGDVDTIASIFAASTTVTMQGDYQITARFASVVASKTETVTDDTVNARTEADTEIDVSGTATVTVAKYGENPGEDPPTGLGLLGKYIDVYVPDTEDVTEIEMRLYYTDAESAGAGVADEFFRLLWWDGTEWAWCSHTGADTSARYIWAKIRADTTPSLADLGGTPFDGGYEGPSDVPRFGCFIATAAYGTDTAEEIGILREFRDTVLLPRSLGAGLVSIYYRTSPPVADFISRYELVRAVVRVGLVDRIVTVLNWSQAWWSVMGR